MATVRTKPNLPEGCRLITPDDANYRAFTGNLRVLSSGDDYVCDVSLDLLDDMTNRNNWRYERLAEHRKKFVRKPLLVAYEGKGTDGQPKFGGHNFVMKRDPKTGEEYASFLDPSSERMVGVSAFDDKDVKVEQHGANKWITSTGVVYEWYAHELVSKLKASQGRGMAVSIETLINEMHMDGDTEVFTDYTILGVTLLGDGIMPAVRDAKIKTLSEMESEMETLKIRAASYRENSQHPTENTNTKTDKGVKKRMSKRTLAELQAKFDAVSENAYRVLAASDDELQVCLMSADGIPYTYEFTSKEDTGAIVPERIKRVNASAAFRFDATEIEVDVNEITDALTADLVAANAKAELNGQRAEKAEGEIKEMKDKENARRVEAAKNAAKAKLAEINSVRKASEQIDEKECEDVLEDCDNGKYTEMEAEDGSWCGDARAAADVAAKCMNAIVEMEKKNSLARNSISVWDVLKKDNGSDAVGVEAVLAGINKE